MNSPQQKQQLNHYFLGPKGEQRKLFMEMIELINNDMIFWRRNFHPKDPPAIPYKSLTSPSGQDFQESLIQNLVHLLAELKMDLPFFSPRYMAHMTADVSLPAMLGYYAGLLYNANNVSSEASPVTLKYELEVGEQFAELFGFQKKTSFGHITSGGTVANFESIFYNKSARFVPVSLGMIIKSHKLPWPEFMTQDLWELSNIAIADIPELLEKFKSYGFEHGIDVVSLLNETSPSELGDQSFWRQARSLFNQEIGDPVILVPSNAHYSWSKGCNLTGVGRSNCRKILMNKDLIMDLTDFRLKLNECVVNRNPIIQTVCVLGSTEFGSFDSLDEILGELKAWNKKGLYTPVHIDAAYGGYFKTMFTPGVDLSEAQQNSETNYPVLYRSLASIREADSITIDPHKLGHTPYGAGVFVTKHGFMKEWVAENADYCLTSENENENFPLGKYILEGSKPGASATSVYFTNKILPLNTDGYGLLLRQMIEDTKCFYNELMKLNQHPGFSEDFKVKVVSKPQSNLICFYIHPQGMNKLSQINNFNEKLIANFFPRPTKHIQDFDYFVSKTKLYRDKLVPSAEDEIFEGIERDTEALLLFRMVFMNMWSQLLNGEGISYFEDFPNTLQRCSKELA